MLEREVEKEVVKYAEGRGCISVKLNGPHGRGKPDRVFFYRGRCLFIEMKKPGEKPTKLQNEWLVRFRDHDFTALVADRPGLGKTMIDNFIKRTDAETDVLKKLFALMRDTIRRSRGKAPLDQEKLEQLAIALEDYTGEPEDF